MSDDRIKILQVVGNTQLGGVASCLLNYMRRCDLENYRFDFVTYAPTAFDGQVKQCDGQAKIYHIPNLTKSVLRGMGDIENICCAVKYDIVHSHMGILSAVVLPEAAAAGVPVRICHAHSTFNRHSDRYLIKKLMRPFAASYATHLMACGRAAAESTFKRRAGEAMLLNNAIEAHKFYCTESEHAAAKNQCGTDKTIILFTGRFAYQKNLSFLLKAFAAAGRKDALLVLLGGGPLQAELEELCAKLGITGSVKFVPPGEPYVWYKAADVFVLPSLYEGLSVSAIEAQAAGLSCIFADSVTKETDITGNCTFLRTDINLWAEALRGNFTRSYDVKEKIVAAGYDIESEAHRLTDYYGQLIGGQVGKS
ncbi:MAG: glycosyltransferase [Clostridia bacterium]|nr:glycosyltransferase [Clostridia bacterium]